MDAEKIKRLRKAKGLTLEQAARAAGMSGKQHWWNIEDGRQGSASISVDLLDRIASALGTTAADLLLPAPKPPKRKGDK